MSKEPAMTDREKLIVALVLEALAIFSISLVWSFYAG